MDIEEILGAVKESLDEELDISFNEFQTQMEGMIDLLDRGDFISVMGIKRAISMHSNPEEFSSFMMERGYNEANERVAREFYERVVYPRAKEEWTEARDSMLEDGYLIEKNNYTTISESLYEEIKKTIDNTKESVKESIDLAKEQARLDKGLEYWKTLETGDDKDQLGKNIVKGYHKYVEKDTIYLNYDEAPTPHRYLMERGLLAETYAEIYGENPLELIAEKEKQLQEESD